jgi:hypothetical protein
MSFAKEARSPDPPRGITISGLRELRSAGPAIAAIAGSATEALVATPIGCGKEMAFRPSQIRASAAEAALIIPDAWQGRTEVRTGRSRRSPNALLREVS